MKHRPLRAVSCVSETSLGLLIEELVERSFRVFQVDGSGITGKLSFMEQAALSLPQPGDRKAAKNWDALSDNLWAELSESPEARVAFVWTHAQNMLVGGLPDLLVAVACLEELSRQVASTTTGFSHPLELRTFLVGSGPNFPALNEF
jgi:hypothetical protein